MPKSNLKLVLDKPEGFRHDRPLTSGAKLVNPATGEEVPGVGEITLRMSPRGGMLRCTAEIDLGGIEFAEPQAAEVTAGRDHVTVEATE